VLTCQHHIQWVRQVAGGLHQCILCTQVVTKKDVWPKLEDLPEEFRRRWEAHEATRPVAEAATPEAPAKPKPPPAKPVATTAAEPAQPAILPAAPLPRPPPARAVVPPPAHDPASGG